MKWIVGEQQAAYDSQGAKVVDENLVEVLADPLMLLDEIWYQWKAEQSPLRKATGRYLIEPESMEKANGPFWSDQVLTSRTSLTVKSCGRRPGTT